MPPLWKSTISEISLLHFGADSEQLGAEEELTDLIIPTRKQNGLAELWRLLGSLPALRYLELDMILLTRLDCVKVFRGPALRNVEVHFTQSDPCEVLDDMRDHIWPRRALRFGRESDKFSTEIAEWIEGERYGSTKKDSFKRALADAKAVEKQKEVYRKGIEDSMVFELSS
ncbi:hypothetical protein F4776DRAFT_675916 [Hypoxylon sp. NC0597]|nr:hypothetical protein F4776DRAFT_675916 [Hypoxylon sp. NC0597]